MNWTDEQRTIINHATGHAKVRAVAGSGKSAVLVERVARLLETGVSPERIQVFMFNTSASASFTDRLATRLSGRNSQSPTVRTFHSLGNSLCRSLEQRGLLPNWRLETRGWVEAKLASEALEASTGEAASKDDEQMLLEFINLVKSDLVSASDKLEETVDITGREFPSRMVDAFDTFERMRAQAGIRFFNDLLYDPVMRLYEDEALQERMGSRYDHILVDEYQDVSDLQEWLLTVIAGKTASVMAVGDVSQCIYEFRGARPELMQCLFDADFPGAVTYDLSYTFRYGHRISLIANHVITQNRGAEDTLCVSHATTPESEVQRLSPRHCGDTHPVVHAINEWVAGGRQLSECAVLLRVYSLAPEIELALLKEGIPYRLEGAEGVLDRPEVSMLLGYLQLAAGQPVANRTEAMLSVPPMGIRKHELQQLADQVGRSGDPAGTLRGSSHLSGGPLAPWIQRRMAQRAELCGRVQKMGAQASVDEVFGTVVKMLGLGARKGPTGGMDPRGGLTETIEGVRAFLGGLTVGEALEMAEAMTSKAERTRQGNAPHGMVLITSAHRSKGLEWPMVVIPGLKEGVFPATEQDSADALMAAERRLFYVAATRATERLVLVHPDDQYLEDMAQAGATDLATVTPLASRFMYEGNVDLSTTAGSALYGSGSTVAGVETALIETYANRIGASLSLVRTELPQQDPETPLSGPGTPCQVEEGMQVRSKDFGLGRVQLVYPMGDRYGIRVVFAGGRERVLMSDIAVLHRESSQGAEAA